MGFFGRTALVVEAAAPAEGGPSLGPGSSGPLRIMADLGSGRRLYDGKVRMTEEHWLVAGMDVDVTCDPNHPDRFEINWESVPSMEARAAAGEYVRRFKCEVDLLEPLWMPLPALVSAVDPTDVEILWNDVPGHDAQLSDRTRSAAFSTSRIRRCGRC